MKKKRATSAFLKHNSFYYRAEYCLSSHRQKHECVEQQTLKY